MKERNSIYNNYKTQYQFNIGHPNIDYIHFLRSKSNNQNINNSNIISYDEMNIDNKFNNSKIIKKNKYNNKNKLNYIYDEPNINDDINNYIFSLKKKNKNLQNNILKYIKEIKLRDNEIDGYKLKVKALLNQVTEKNNELNLKSNAIIKLSEEKEMNNKETLSNYKNNNSDYNLIKAQLQISKQNEEKYKKKILI